jgi:hypothetical protein
MFAGGERVADGCTPAKPPWSEVMIFLYFFLRQINSTIISAHKKEPAFK